MDMDKEARLKSYIENIGQVFFRGNWSPEDYKYLTQVIPAYLKFNLILKKSQLNFANFRKTRLVAIDFLKKRLNFQANNAPIKVMIWFKTLNNFLI